MILVRIINAFNANVNNFLIKIGKFVLLCLAISYISYKLFNFTNEQYANWVITIKPSMSFFLLLFFVFFLSIVNWGIEALKWKMLANKLQNISFLLSYKSVLFGVAMGMITPKRIGEFAGKTIALEKSKRAEGVIINTAGTFCQLLITIIAGLISFSFIFHKNKITFLKLFSFSVEYVIGLSLIITLLTVLFFLKTRIINLLKSKTLKNIYLKLTVFKKINLLELLHLFSLSSLRYLVFMIQFYLLFILVVLQLSFAEVFIFQSLVFFIMTLLPITAFSELTVKSSIAVFLFGHIFAGSMSNLYGYEISLLVANGLLWLINLGIPAFVGAVWRFYHFGLPLKKSFIHVQ